MNVNPMSHMMAVGFAMIAGRATAMAQVNSAETTLFKSMLTLPQGGYPDTKKKLAFILWRMRTNSIVESEGKAVMTPLTAAEFLNSDIRTVEMSTEFEEFYAAKEKELAEKPVDLLAEFDVPAFGQRMN